MTAHLFESAFHDLIRAYCETGRSPLRAPVFVNSEGLNSASSLGWMTLSKTETGFQITFERSKR